VLDKFSKLVLELDNEYHLRKKQYNFYRDKLLTFPQDKVTWKTLGEIVDIITAPTKLKKAACCLIGTMPIVDQGVKLIAGYTDESVKALPVGDYVIFGDHSEHIKYVDFVKEVFGISAIVI